MNQHVHKDNLIVDITIDVVVVVVVGDYHSLFGTGPTIPESSCQNIDVFEKCKRSRGHVVRGGKWRSNGGPKWLEWGLWHSLPTNQVELQSQGLATSGYWGEGVAMGGYGGLMAIVGGPRGGNDDRDGGGWGRELKKNWVKFFTILSICSHVWYIGVLLT